MKKVFRLLTLLLCVAIVCASFSSCSVFSTQSKKEEKNTQPKEQSITVHYYDGKTMTYTLESGKNKIQTNFIAPNGQVIKGLYDDTGIQYADYDCIVDFENNGVVPSVLYARYEDVDISYLDDDPFTTYDEEPHGVSGISGKIGTWEFNPSKYPDDQKMISACLCNPYADLIITATFEGKGFGYESYVDIFTAWVSVCGERVGKFQIKAFDSKDTYTKYTFTARIKAKQLTNGDYEVTFGAKGNYGMTECRYSIKNIRLDFAFDFNSDSESDTQPVTSDTTDTGLANNGSDMQNNNGISGGQNNNSSNNQNNN